MTDEIDPSSISSDVEKALKYAEKKFSSDSYKQSFYIHSKRVASFLMHHNENDQIIVAAILHDLIEEGDTTYEELVMEFDRETANIVLSLTHDKKGSYTEKLKYSLDSYERSIKEGYASVVIRAADLIDNSYHYNTVKAKDAKSYMYKKYTSFMEISDPVLNKTKYSKMLKNIYQKNVAALADLDKPDTELTSA